MTEESGPDSARARDFSFLYNVHTAFGVKQPPTQWVPGAVSPGVRRQDRKVDHSPPSNAEVKHAGGVFQTYVYTAWCLINPGRILHLPFISKCSVHEFTVLKQLTDQAKEKAKSCPFA
jgi:hypothetical protein